MAREYSGKDTQISFLGRGVAVRSITYGASQEKTNTYVMGSKEPYSQTAARKEFTGEMVLPQSEFEAIIRSLPAGSDLLDIAPFPVTILYLDEVSGFFITDELRQVEFAEYTKEMAFDSDMMEVTLPLRIGRVVLNIS